MQNISGGSKEQEDHESNEEDDEHEKNQVGFWKIFKSNISIFDKKF